MPRLLIRKTYSIVTAFGSFLAGAAVSLWYFEKRQETWTTDRKVAIMEKPCASKMDSPLDRSGVAGSFDKTIEATDSTLKQLSTAKDTFNGFEAFYKRFADELSSVKEEYRIELKRFESQINGLNKNREKLLSKLQNSKEDINKQKDEISSYKKKQAELEWENHKLSRQNRLINEQYLKDKQFLQHEIEILRTQKLSDVTSVRRSLKDTECEKLDVAEKEAEELETQYRQAVFDKEVLHKDIVSLQKRVCDLQDENTKNQDELMTQLQNANVRAFKGELQLANVEKHNESLKRELEECGDEINRLQEKNDFLQKDIFDLKQSLAEHDDKFSSKSRQFEMLTELNNALENKLEVIRDDQQSVEKVSNIGEKDVVSPVGDMPIQTAKQDIESRTMVLLKTENARLHSDVIELTKQLSSPREQISKFVRRPTLELCLHQEPGSDFLEEIRDLSTNSGIDLLTQSEPYQQLVHERDDLKQKASFAERKVKELKQVIFHNEDINRELEHKLECVSKDLLKAEAKNKINSNQLQDVNIELENEKKKKENCQRDILEVQNKLNDAERVSERIQVKLKFYVTENEDLKKSISQKDSKITSLNDDVCKLHAKLELVENEENRLHEENLINKSELKNLQKQHEILLQEKENLDAEILNGYQSVKELQSKIHFYESEKQEINQQVLLLQENLNTSGAELQETSKQNAMLESRTYDTVLSARQMSDELHCLRIEVGESKKLLDLSKREISEKECRIEEMRREVAEKSAFANKCHDEYERSKSLILEAQGKNNELECELERKSAEISRLQTLNKHLNDLNEKTERHKDELIVQLESENGRQAIKEKYFEKKQSEEFKKLDKYKSKVEILQSQRESTLKEMFVATEDLHCANEEIANLSLELKKSQDEKYKEATKIHQLESNISALEQDLSQVQQLKQEMDDALNEQKIKCFKLENSVEILSKQRNTVTEKLDAANKMNLSSKEEILNITSQMTEQQTTIESLNKVISTKEELVEELRRNKLELEAELIKVRQELWSLQIVFEKNKSERCRLEKRCLSYEQKAQGLEASYFEARESKLLLEQEISIEKLKLQSCKNQLTNVDSDRVHRSNGLERSQDSFRETSKELLQCQTTLCELEIKHSSTSKELKENKRVFEKIRQEKHILEFENISLKKELESLKRTGEARVAVLETSLEAAMSESFEASLFSDFGNNESGLEMQLHCSHELENQAIESVNSMTQKLKDLRKVLSKKDDELRIANKEKMEMSEVQTILQKKLAKMATRNESFEKDIKDLKTQLADYQLQISQLEVKYDFEIKQKCALESHLNESMSKINDMRAKVHRLEQENADKMCTIELSGKESLSRHQDLEYLLESRHAVDDMNEKLFVMFKENTIEDRKRREDHFSLKNELLELQSSLFEKDAQLKRLQLEKDRVLCECKASLHRISTLEQNNFDLTNEISHLQLSTQNVEEELLSQTIKNRDKLTVELRKKIEELNIEISNKNVIIKDLKDRIVLLEKELELSTKSIKELEHNSLSLLQSQTNAERELKALKNKESRTPKVTNGDNGGKALKSQIKDLKQQIEEFQEKEDGLVDQITACKDETSRWKKNYHAIKCENKELETELLSLESLKDEKSLQFEQFEVENKKMKNKICFLEEELEKARQNKIHLENKLNDKEHELYLLAKRSKTEVSHDIPIKKEQLLLDTKTEERLLLLTNQMKELQSSLHYSRKQRDEAEKKMLILETKEHDSSLKVKNHEAYINMLLKELKRYREESVNKSKEIHLNKTCGDFKHERHRHNKFGIDALWRQYSVVIEEIMELSRLLQNYKLDTKEWNSHYNQIIVSSERLHSAYHALNSLLDDIHRLYKSETSNHEDPGCEMSEESEEIPFEKRRLNSTKMTSVNDCTDGQLPMNIEESNLERSEASRPSSQEETSKALRASIAQSEIALVSHYLVDSDSIKEGTQPLNAFGGDEMHIDISESRLDVSAINGPTDQEHLNAVSGCKSNNECNPTLIRTVTSGAFDGSTSTPREGTVYRSISPTEKIVEQSLTKVNSDAKEGPENHPILTCTGNSDMPEKEEPIQTIGVKHEIADARLINHLSKENKELKMQLEVLKKKKGNSNALIADLRVMVARLNNELEGSKKDGLARTKHLKDLTWLDVRNNNDIGTLNIYHNSKGINIPTKVEDQQRKLTEISRINSNIGSPKMETESSQLPLNCEASEKVNKPCTQSIANEIVENRVHSLKKNNQNETSIEFASGVTPEIKTAMMEEAATHSDHLSQLNDLSSKENTIVYSDNEASEIEATQEQLSSSCQSLEGKFHDGLLESPCHQNTSIVKEENVQTFERVEKNEISTERISSNTSSEVDAQLHYQRRCEETSHTGKDFVNEICIENKADVKLEKCISSSDINNDIDLVALSSDDDSWSFNNHIPSSPPQRDSKASRSSWPYFGLSSTRVFSTQQSKMNSSGTFMRRNSFTKKYC